jgi:hypothetical protein
MLVNCLISYLQIQILPTHPSHALVQMADCVSAKCCIEHLHGVYPSRDSKQKLFVSMSEKECVYAPFYWDRLENGAFAYKEFSAGYLDYSEPQSSDLKITAAEVSPADDSSVQNDGLDHGSVFKHIDCEMKADEFYQPMGVWSVVKKPREFDEDSW